MKKIANIGPCSVALSRLDNKSQITMLTVGMPTLTYIDVLTVDGYI